MLVVMYVEGSFGGRVEKGNERGKRKYVKEGALLVREGLREMRGDGKGFYFIVLDVTMFVQ